MRCKCYRSGGVRPGDQRILVLALHPLIRLMIVEWCEWPNSAQARELAALDGRNNDVENEPQDWVQWGHGDSRTKISCVATLFQVVDSVPAVVNFVSKPANPRPSQQLGNTITIASNGPELELNTLHYKMSGARAPQVMPFCGSEERMVACATPKMSGQRRRVLWPAVDPSLAAQRSQQTDVLSNGGGPVRHTHAPPDEQAGTRPPPGQ